MATFHPLYARCLLAISLSQAELGTHNTSQEMPEAAHHPYEQPTLPLQRFVEPCTERQKSPIRQEQSTRIPRTRTLLFSLPLAAA